MQLVLLTFLAFLYHAFSDTEKIHIDGIEPDAGPITGESYIHLSKFFRRHTSLSSRRAIQRKRKRIQKAEMQVWLQY